jgi:hypothetical protein
MNVIGKPIRTNNFITKLYQQVNAPCVLCLVLTMENHGLCIQCDRFVRENGPG